MNFNIEIPSNKEELINLLGKYKNKNYRIGAGCTDLIMELKKKCSEPLTVINISQINDGDFNNINTQKSSIIIGANTSVFKICNNNEILKNYPVLNISAQNLASNQIRQVATVGGNLCTASPSGDLICALMALKAELEIINSNAEKRKISILDFYKGVRKTDLQSGEFLSSITILPNNIETNKLHSGFIKIGTRKSMECSVVSLAYHIQIDKNNKIIEVGIAFGASAPTVKFAQKASEFLIDRNIAQISETDIEKFAKLVLEYASPIDDLRATAWYRKQVLFNISKSILEDIQ